MYIILLHIYLYTLLNLKTFKINALNYFFIDISYFFSRLIIHGNTNNNKQKQTNYLIKRYTSTYHIKKKLFV